MFDQHHGAGDSSAGVTTPVTLSEKFAGARGGLDGRAKTHHEVGQPPFVTHATFCDPRHLLRHTPPFVTFCDVPTVYVLLYEHVIVKIMVR
jgi:hypothetical protein